MRWLEQSRLSCQPITDYGNWILYNLGYPFFLGSDILRSSAHWLQAATWNIYYHISWISKNLCLHPCRYNSMLHSCSGYSVNDLALAFHISTEINLTEAFAVPIRLLQVMITNPDIKFYVGLCCAVIRRATKCPLVTPP